ncbi:MAG: S8 family serine peptidase [Candidatus Heimdallarchaeota archaeon]|nr:MAG: S8 family serine peptidase [Candidatus Heimdallarchaeota archaeon]
MMFPTRYRFLQVFFPIFLITTSVIFTSTNPIISFVDNQNSFPYISKNLSKKELSKDFLIMFYDKIPNLDRFEPLINRKFCNFPVIHIKFNDSETKQSFFENYNHKIYQMEPNRIFKSSPRFIPEPNLSKSSINTEIQDSTGASVLHSLGIEGEGVKIGIIDTGVDDDTAIFGTRVVDRESFVSIENGYSADRLNPEPAMDHGTNVANLAAGNTRGIAPRAEIYSAKIIHDNVITGAGGGGGEETTVGMLEAIDYLINNSIDVVNISLGQYHNLASGLRDEIINYASIIHNIVFTVSAGNSGTSYGDRGTLNNPATALQCIAVSASDISGINIANFASRGPKVDYSIKPDITAPGINTPWEGTSFAAPIVAGGAALLINFLKNKGLSYSAATIKAALLAGARTLNKPIWEEGAGFINITRSLEILNSTNEVNNTPDLIYLHPQKLPFDPYRVLFNGSSLIFNLSVISSREVSTSLNISDSISDFVSTPETSYILNNTTLVPINFTIPASSESQYVSGFIEISNEFLIIEFEIRETDIQILFDETANSIVRHGYGTGSYEIRGDSSNTIGLYSAFTQFLAYEHNYSVTPHVKGELTLTKVLEYDVLILANPFSNSTDKYMDWVVDPSPDYLALSKKSLNAVYQFISKGGGLLVINGNDDAYYNITGLNEFLEQFNLQIQSKFSGGIGISDIVNPQDFTTDISSFPFRGNYIQASGTNTQVIAEYNDEPTLALYEDPGGGRVLLFGTDLIFDNFGFSSYAYNGNSLENSILALNSITWLAAAEKEFVETSTSLPEFPYPIIFLMLIFFLGIIYILLINRTKN